MDTAEFARRQIASARADLIRDTGRLVEVTTHLHAAAQHGERVEGELERLVQYTVSALRRAAELHGMEDTASYTIFPFTT